MEDTILTREGLVQMDNCGAVPLKSINVNVRVYNFVADVQSELTYHNDTEEEVEVAFVFPMDDGSAVYNFEADIRGRTIVAECQEKQQALETYKNARNCGDLAFLMEESENSRDIFRCCIGNLPAKSSTLIRFSYVIELALCGEKGFHFTLPTVLNPRYDPGPEDGGMSEEEQLKMEKAVLLTKPKSFKFSLSIKGGKTVSNVECSDKIATVRDKSSGSVKITLVEEFKFDHDLTVDIYYDELHEPLAITEFGSAEKDGLLKKNMVMLNFYPQTETEDPRREFIFVVDRSGSMYNCMDETKETLLYFLKGLPVDCYFNIISFGSNFTSLFKKSEKYSKGTLDKALKLQTGMSADMGGTEILQPLKHIYKQNVFKDYTRQIFLLTDGSVSNTKAVIDLVYKNRSSTRVFTFGLGQGASTSLVKGVAKAGNGKAEFISDMKNMQRKVMGSLQCAMHNTLKDVSLEWDLPPDITPKLIPSEMPHVLFSEKYIIYAILEGDLSHVNEQGTEKYCAILTGTSGQNTMKYKLDINLKPVDEKEVVWQKSLPLHRLAAKSAIIELEMSQEGRYDSRQSKPDVMVLSLSSNVLSSATAFVGVDSESHSKIEPSRILEVHSDLRLQCNLTSLFLDTGASQFGMKAAKLQRRAWSTGIINRVSGFFSSAKGLFFKDKKTKAVSHSVSANIANDASEADEAESASSDKCEEDIDTEVTTKENVSVTDFVMLQTFAGSWELNEKLAKLLNKSLKTLQEDSPIKDEEAWGTALVLVKLKMSFNDRRAEWSLLEQKALTWLKQRKLTSNKSELTVDELLESAAGTMK